MRMKLIPGAAVLALMLAVAGCAAGTTSGGTGDAGSSAPPASQSSDTGGDSGTATGAVLGTAESSLGTIVVDGKGMTVYMFDDDTQGTKTSACTGQCVTNWPFVTTDSATPEVKGVTGTVGTIDTPDGKKQVTLNGWPLYYFAGDSKPGDTNGQGVGGIWWVLSPAGDKIGG
jgi:predicted lipoprotein with Yx(FWY)xxD motif